MQEPSTSSSYFYCNPLHKYMIDKWISIQVISSPQFKKVKLSWTGRVEDTYQLKDLFMVVSIKLNSTGAYVTTSLC